MRDQIGGTMIKTGIVQSRSEGLAVGIRLLESGLLSLHGEDEPLRVDAEALRKLNVEKLWRSFKSVLLIPC